MTNKKTYDPLEGMRGVIAQMGKMKTGLESTLSQLTADASNALGELPDNCTDEDALRVKSIKLEMVEASKKQDVLTINKLITELNGILNK